jgi:CheY-like chemotaxis protein
MSENILVVEYEPRYTDRVRQALVGQPFTPTFAKDGEEAIRALEGEQPRLIVLSSVVPKVSTTELIRAIRGRKPLQETPILLTVSGYNGKSPKADAQRVGASDILPKPYSETEFLGKVQQMLGIRGDTPIGKDAADLERDLRRPRRRRQAGARKDVDLESNRRRRQDARRHALRHDAAERKDTSSAPTQPGAQAVPQPAARKPPAQPPQGVSKRTKPSTTGDLDKMLSDTLSGLEKNARKNTGAGTTVADAASGRADRGRQYAEAPRALQHRADAGVRSRSRSGGAAGLHARAAAARRAGCASMTMKSTDGTKFGQYVLIEKIATGGMAEVWKARMRGVEGFQKIVAIKKILPHLSDNQDFIEMFIDEAKLAAQLNHNNIIHIYDLGKIQSSYYIAMEYIDGFDLKAILRRGRSAIIR